MESLQELSTQFPDADGIWDFTSWPKSEIAIRERLSAPDGTPELTAAEMLTQLARAQALQGNFDEARKTLDRAHEIIQGNDPALRARAEIRWLLEQGRFFSLNRSPSKAVNFFSQAWTLAMAKGENFFAIDAAAMLAITQSPKAQYEWLQKALALAESSKHPQAALWHAQLFSWLGWHYFDVRKYDQALASFEKALSSPRFPGDESKVLVIRWSLGRVLRALGRIDEALKVQQEILRELATVGQTNGHVHLEIAECFQVSGKVEEAKPFFELAYKDLSAEPWYADNKSSELSRMQHLYKLRY